MAKTKPKFQSPGQALKYYLVKNDWTQEDLAHILTISLKHTNELIKDKKSISIDIAILLGKVFELDAYEWVMLDTKFQLLKKKEQKKEQTKEQLVERQVEVYKYLPINELLKKGWLQPYDNIESLNKQLHSFWGLPKDKPLDFSSLKLNGINIEYRKSEAYKDSSNEVNAKAWYQMALNHSNKLNVASYDVEGLKELFSNLHKYTIKQDGISKFLNDLAKVGVKFVFLSHLSKTYLDGAAFLSNTNPVVTLTGRYDRVDNFWFTLAHEISHVILHLHKNKMTNMVFMDDTNSGIIDSKKELEANQLAEKMLLQEQILEFFEEYIGYITDDKVGEFSSLYKIHPSIVVGILAFNEKVSYSTLHRFKESVRDKIPNKYRAELL
ncbi:ImmA/IrrE family metallo-endopeptidase [Confluentibacter sediminis]|uniref:ImmA/IrrE family metallo-endopeptidase n=1 Tax=Confluentibacter sediminis TaxID=2219045 RepID=UPI000DACC94A|nr:ImmA/IrrE family metallo-endopeptidase [Confluentibacter sediminis]